MSQALFGPWGANKLSVSLHVPTVLLTVEGVGLVDPCSDLQAFLGRVCRRCMHAYQSAGGRDWLWPGARHSHGLSRKQFSQNLPCLSLSMW